MLYRRQRDVVWLVSKSTVWSGGAWDYGIVDAQCGPLARERLRARGQSVQKCCWQCFLRAVRSLRVCDDDVCFWFSACQCCMNGWSVECRCYISRQRRCCVGKHFSILCVFSPQRRCCARGGMEDVQTVTPVRQFCTWLVARAAG